MGRHPDARRLVQVCAHPGFAAAVAVLVVNDRLLKWTVPGWWTGKLSDVAGVFVVAVLLGVVLRPRFGALLAGVGFTAIKVSAVAATLAAPLIGGRTLQDRSDLIGLFAVVPAYRLARRFNVRAEPSWGRAALGTVSLSVALVAVTGTSCAVDPAVDGFVVEGDLVWAHMDRSRSYPEEPIWALSRDGGGTWVGAEAPAGSLTASKEACSADRCWRVASLVVEERVGAGAWRPVFRFTARQMEAMDARGGGCDSRPELLFGAVSVVSLPDGPHVVVGMGNQGVVVRSPTGAWERRPVLDLRPLRTSGSPQLAFGVQLAAMLTVLGLTIVLTVRAVRRPGRRKGNAAAVAAVGTMGLLTMVGGFSFAAVDFVVAGFLTVGAAALVLVASLVVASRPARPEPSPGSVPPGSGGWPPPARPG